MDAVFRVVVRPGERPRRGVVQPDVAQELLPEIGHRGEDAARDHIALDLREPELDLIEPGAIRRREVEMHGGMGRLPGGTAFVFWAERLSRMTCSSWVRR